MNLPELLITPRVLLVDDEPQQLQLGALVMEMCGWSVVTARHPVEAICIMADEIDQIDFAVLDYDMPVMNGCALANRLRSLCPELTIILYSGAIDIPQHEMTSIDAFIPKDDGMDRLLPQIAEFAQAGTRPPTLVAPGTELCFRAQDGF